MPAGHPWSGAEIVAPDLHERLVVAAIEIDTRFRYQPSMKNRFEATGLQIENHAARQLLAPKKVNRVKSVYSDSMAMIHTNTSTATGGTRMA